MLQPRASILLAWFQVLSEEWHLLSRNELVGKLQSLIATSFPYPRSQALRHRKLAGALDDIIRDYVKHLRKLVRLPDQTARQEFDEKQHAHDDGLANATYIVVAAANVLTAMCYTPSS